MRLATGWGARDHADLDSVLHIDLRIDRAQRLLRMLENDSPLLAARVALLSPERQKAAKSFAQRLAERTRAEIQDLLDEKSLMVLTEQPPSAAD